MPTVARHLYQQRFAFDEVHGNDDSSSVNKDYFFLHPAFKEWVLSLPEQLNKPFARLAVGVIGDLQPYEAKPPLLRLGLVRGRVVLKLRTARRMAATEKGVASDPLRFLFVALWACRDLKQTSVNLSELKEAWARLQTVEPLKTALNIYLPTRVDLLVERIRDWGKKINGDAYIRQLKRSMVEMNSNAVGARRRKRPQPVGQFISISARSDMGAQVEISFPDLSLDELDFDQKMYALMASRAN